MIVTVARLLVASAVVALLANCADKSEIAPEPGTGGGAASGGSGGGAGGAKPVACPAGTAGAEQILIQTDTGAAYCIDQREVTRGEYKAFLDAKAGDVSGQPAGCAWNERYAPLEDDPSDPEGAYGCPTDSWALETHPDYPVVCVDICDAFAYCAWADKRLCGVMGASAADVNKVADHKTVAGSKVETILQKRRVSIAAEGPQSPRGPRMTRAYERTIETPRLATIVSRRIREVARIA